MRRECGGAWPFRSSAKEFTPCWSRWSLGALALSFLCFSVKYMWLFGRTSVDCRRGTVEANDLQNRAVGDAACFRRCARPFRDTCFYGLLGIIPVSEDART